MNTPSLRRTITTAALSLACPVLSLPGQSMEDPDAVTWIPRVESPPVIDGQIDQLWHAQEPFSIARVTTGTVMDAADLSAEWYGLYDATYFYFLIDVTDQFLESEAGADIWRNDRIEVYFNMDNVKPGGNARTGDNYQYAFHWNKPDEEFVTNSSWEGIIWSQTTTEGGYIVEIAIPWDTLTFLDTSPGFAFGFDLAINDNDGFPTYDSVTYWWNSTGGGLWSNIDGAGTVGLGELFDGNFAPELELPEMPIQAAEGTPAAIELQASDANPADALSFTSDNLPAFAELVDNGDRTASLILDPLAGDANVYTFEVTVSDGSRLETREIDLIVKDPSVTTQSPEFNPVPGQTVGQGNLLFVELSTVDRDSLSLEIKPLDLPDWAKLEDRGDKTATLSLNPGFDVAPGDYTATLEVRDPDFNTASVTVSITVTETEKLGTYYVDPENGDIQNNGSAENPWSTLEAVFEAGKRFEAGDIITLRSGYHGDPVVTGSNAGVVTIQPEAGASPVLSRLSLSSSSRNWHIHGLEISRSHAPVYTSEVLLSMGGTDNTVEDCTLHSVPDISNWFLSDWRGKAVDGVSISGQRNRLLGNTILNTRFAVSMGGSFNTVRGNTIRNFSGDGVRVLGNDLVVEYNTIADNYNVDDNHDDGIQSWSTGPNGVGSGVVYRAVIRGNFIIERTDPSRRLQGPLQGIGCFDGMFQDWVVENNVVVVNQWQGIGFLGAINCRIVNNTVIDQQPFSAPGPTWIQVSTHKNWSSAPADQKAYWVGRDNVVRNNLVTSYSVNASVVADENNVIIRSADYDTHFMDFPFDLRLKAGAPAIDAGVNTGVPAQDADGQPRILDGNGDGTATVDLGAYEFGAAEWRGWPTAAGETADTGAFLGWVHTARDPWVYAYRLERFVYLSGDAVAGAPGGWVYLPAR